MKYNLDNVTGKVIDNIHALGFGSTEIPTKPEDKLNDDLGMDSLDVMELSIELEKEFGVPLELSSLDMPNRSAYTVQDVVNIIILAFADQNG